MVCGANLRWNFSEGMKLTFMAETKHQAISSIRGALSPVRLSGFSAARAITNVTNALVSSVNQTK